MLIVSGSGNIWSK